jgi:excinuclease ABC subunit B
MPKGFELVSDFQPTGDQPAAIDKLVQGIGSKQRFQHLLGVTGSGKTFTIANVIARLQRPTLIIAHNKTLAAQLCGEFRTFFPNNAVAYFVSYYDYYQPEAYIPQSDTYIEKDSSINEEIDRLRHFATKSLFERRDVIVVASVSCIYGLGSPEDYEQIILSVERGETINRDAVLRRLVDMQYKRTAATLERGKFRVRGDVLEINSIHEEMITRIELFGDEVEKITILDPLTGEIKEERDKIVVFAASHYVAPLEKQERAVASIEAELAQQLDYMRNAGKLLEAQRLEQRTRFDLEMIREIGYCNGIENYSLHFDGRTPGQPPYTLLDYFPKDFLLVIDESHQTVPQVSGQWAGDHSRKVPLVEYGFRLPTCFDNRPLTFPEFEAHINQAIFTSATPGPYELQHAEQVVEQIIRPTGLVDPEVVVRPTKGQIDDLIGEIKGRVARHERVMVTTLTKKMAENLSEYLADMGIRVNYLHSEVETLVRSELLRDFRLGNFDVVVGINLLREGLDLPEVSLVAILDADKQGFLRSETSLIQTSGRAARNVNGQVIMYADQVTDSMRRALSEMDRRRNIQLEYNREHNITPRSVIKEIRELLHTAAGDEAEQDAIYLSSEEARHLPDLLEELERDMRIAAQELRFEDAAKARDRLVALSGGAVGRPPKTPRKAKGRGRKRQNYSRG